MSGNSIGVEVVSVLGKAAPPVQLGTVSEAEFNQVRSAVLAASVLHGTAGPSDDMPRESKQALSVDDPDFYVVDDQYGDDRRVFVEPKPSAISPEWLSDLAAALRGFPGWDVLVSPGEGISLLIRNGRVEISGWAPRSHDLPRLIDDLCGHIRASRATRAETQRLRAAEVGALLADAWRISLGQGLGFVAVFRTRSDGTPGDSVWLLHLDDRSAFELDDYSFEPDVVRPSLHWVERPARMTPYLPGSNPSGNDAVLLAEWDLVREGQAVAGANSIRVRRGNRTWQFSLLCH